MGTLFPHRPHQINHVEYSLSDSLQWTGYTVFYIATILIGFWVIMLLLPPACVPETNPNAVAADNSLGSSRSMFTTKNNTSIIAQRGGVAVLPCSVQLNSQATVCAPERKERGDSPLSPRVIPLEINLQDKPRWRRQDSS